MPARRILSNPLRFIPRAARSECSFPVSKVFLASPRSENQGKQERGRIAAVFALPLLPGTTERLQVHWLSVRGAVRAAGELKRVDRPSGMDELCFSGDALGSGCTSIVKDMHTSKVAGQEVQARTTLSEKAGAGRSWMCGPMRKSLGLEVTTASPGMHFYQECMHFCFFFSFFKQEKKHWSNNNIFATTLLPSCALECGGREDREAEFRSSIKAWYAEMDTVCSALLILLSAALDLEPAVLLDMKSGHASSLNLFSVAAGPGCEKTQVTCIYIHI